MKTAKYFSASWCGPCRTFKPVVNELISEGHNIEIVDDLLAINKLDTRPVILIGQICFCDVLVSLMGHLCYV